MWTQTARAHAGRTVVRWRRERLVEAGFPSATAAELAADARYDTHALIGLVEAGCPLELAVSILAPIEEES
jgi:hypothetical protein